MPGRLEGKVYVITGTGGSMGPATALAFAREGASVVGCDLAVEPAQATVEAVRGVGGDMVSMHPCHLSEPADRQALVQLAASAYGRIDVLFNLAAMSYFDWLEDITDEEWHRARGDEVDLVFYLTRAAWPHLKDSGGVVVNMASLNASPSFKILPSLAQTTNKAAIIGMTRQLARPGARDSRQLDLARSYREQRHQGAAQRPCMGGLHARQDAARPTRQGPRRSQTSRCSSARMRVRT
jgi:NAD(P)-dependent dehydrogenase (short-subunit alcohol dehydrogenase family)